MKTGNGVTKLSMELSHMPPVKSLSHTHTHTNTCTNTHMIPQAADTFFGMRDLEDISITLPVWTAENNKTAVVFPRHPAHWPTVYYLPLICSSASHMPCWGNPSLPSQNSIQKLKSSKRDIWNGHITWMNSDTCDWMESLVWSLLIGSGLHFLIWICWFWWRPPVQWTRHPLTADKQ